MKAEALLHDATALVALAAKREDLDSTAKARFVRDALVDRLPPEARVLVELTESPLGQAVLSLVEVAAQHAFDKWKAKRNAKRAEREAADPPPKRKKFGGASGSESAR
jgi:hypothetical protein